MSPFAYFATKWGAYPNITDSRSLITLRFWAVGLLFLSTAIFYFFDLNISWITFLILSFVVLIYNLLYLILVNRDFSFPTFLQLQVAVDWLALFFVAIYSGGITSPAIYIFPVYGAICGFVLNRRILGFFSTLGIVLINSLLAVDIFTSDPLGYDYIYSVGSTILYCTVLVTITFLSSWISGRLRREIDTIAKLQDKIDRDNTRLRKAYDLAINMNADLTLDGTLKAITSTVITVPNVTACVIRLLNDDLDSISIMDTSGVSEEHARSESVKLVDCPIDLLAISSREPVYIANVLEDTRFEYKDDARAENLISMIAIPLITRSRPIGVIRCYTGEPYQFSDNDITFLKTIATNASLSISNSIQYQSLEKLNKTRSAFLRLTTHELRSPMAAVQSILRLVLDGFTGKITRKQKSLFERAYRRIDRLLELVSDLLELEGYSGRELEYGEYNLRDILSEVVRDISPKSDSKGIRMRVHIAKGDLCIHCDYDSIYRLLENLIDNAVKYSPEGGEVIINVEEVNGIVSIRITDNGIGIPKESLPHLFTEFYRARNARKKHVHGTGLGLAICRKIVHSHGGSIVAFSTQGKGTVFTVELPLNHDSPC